MATDLVLVLVFAASVSSYAILRGGMPERYCAAIMGTGILIDRFYPMLFDERGFHELSTSRLTFDVLQFAGYLWVALLANRTWPLWMAAAQLLCIVGSTSVLIVQEGDKQAYWALTQLPIFIQLLALGFGAFAHTCRVRRVGDYNCWSPKYIRAV